MSDLEFLKAVPCSDTPRPLVVTLPHSGEEAPPEAPWLASLSREVYLMDLDRFVDELYEPALTRLQIPRLTTRVHRYAVDLNRYPEDIDSDTVAGAPLPGGTHTKGFHWAKSTKGDRILSAPIPAETHAILVAKYHDPFHQEFEAICAPLRRRFGRLFHLDCHSMPSRGTGAHADAGSRRPDVVVSDFEGTSSRKDFVEAIVASFRAQGLEVSINWPYKGGRITQRYGRPAQNHHTVQIELNRALYLDESTRERLEPGFATLQQTLDRMLSDVSEFIGWAP
jgi:N-formylglutamate deformylase